MRKHFTGDGEELPHSVFPLPLYIDWQNDPLAPVLRDIFSGPNVVEELPETLHLLI